ncbi:sulfate reduction electron transfer complex DsrMKJOP subunit DsrM [Candidatus Zixiibacteriota bacterium]
MRVLVSLVAVLVLMAVAYFGAGSSGGQYLFGVIVPYAAMALFVLGVIYRVMSWAKSPVPFRITSTCGQQRSLPWIKNNYLETPHNMLGVLGRMALEVFFFRSLFRNTKAEIEDRPRFKFVYGANKYLWLGALAFHWSFLLVFIRHYRFFAEPVPGFVVGLQSLDGLFQVWVPSILISNVLILGALVYLWGRRLTNPQVRYISLAADHFPLLLLLGIAGTGVYMRYFSKVDLIGIKELAMGLVSFSPVVPEGIAPLFFMHLFLVSVLFAYFPVSKLMHMGGIFFSPTRNLAANNREKRHLNPWNYPVKVHTYEEYEEEFRDVMKAADMPVEKE